MLRLLVMLSKGTKMSTTTSGNRFRDSVADLLRAGGYQVHTEIQLGSKRVDIYFEERRFASFRRFAVEAKNFGRSLKNNDFEKIYGGYAALLKENLIDHIMVVSTLELEAPAAQGLLKALASQISYHRLKDFQEEILGFQAFLGNFLNRHEREGLEHYFVQPTLSDGRHLMTALNEWLEDDGDSAPVAIIAGYGMGKTSVAKHFTYNLAKRFLAGDDSRIPVYVSLGGISREQGLEGLISTALTSGLPSVRNFSFPVFEMLNEAGRFLIILDGFDEMKHMMSEAEFRANFDELHRLVAGRSKVLLLGRPTAFLSDSEHAYVLRGSARIGAQTHRPPGSPNYTEVRLRPFTPDQVRKFLACYFRFQRESGKIEVDEEFAAQRIRELESAEHEELIARPVHARMLADLAGDRGFIISHLTRFQLYDHFVAHLIDREGKKLGRGSQLKDVDRRAFSCDLAWHLWLDPSGSTSGCRIEDIPPHLFAPYLPSQEDPIALRRALLSGSFLDEKAAGVFYFAHRSFQEFLVAEFIWSNLTEGEDSAEIIDQLGSAISREVYDFLVERDDRSFFRTLLSELARYSAALPLEGFIVVTRSEIMREVATGRAAAFFTAWDAGTMLAHAMVHNREDDGSMIRVARQIGSRASRKPGVLLSAIRTVLLLGPRADLPREIRAKIVVGLMFARAETDIEQLAIEMDRGKKSRALRDTIFEAVTAEEGDHGQLTMELNVGIIMEIAAGVAPQPIDDSSMDRGQLNWIYRAGFDDFFSHVPDPGRERLRTFYQRDAHLSRKLNMRRLDRKE
ncbi:MAG: NACHT domain-containing protein [Alphaproteobacteria bacterium]|nr:NACHT domain-containing protein [Alphaproteobacteria bacterium]MBV9900128.1 NACHT domain-containing protein [Alphaproteobacteria bacterium]